MTSDQHYSCKFNSWLLNPLSAVTFWCWKRGLANTSSALRCSTLRCCEGNQRTVTLLMLNLAASLCPPSVGVMFLKHAFAVGASLQRVTLVVCVKRKTVVFVELSGVWDGGTTTTRKRICVTLPIFDHVSYEQAEDVNTCCTGYYVVYCLF